MEGIQDPTSDFKSFLAAGLNIFPSRIVSSPNKFNTPLFPPLGGGDTPALSLPLKGEGRKGRGIVGLITRRME